MARKPDTPCASCGKLLWSSSTSLPTGQRKCHGCRRSEWKHTCTACGNDFVSRQSRLYCSVGCSNRDLRTSGIDRLRPQPCADCGVEVRSAGTIPLCPGHQVERKLERYRRKNRRRRGDDIASEPYTLAQIAARDGLRCGLCGRRVNMRLKRPHLLSPSIDHVVPISESRDDTRANVQLAHLSCNVRKGVRAMGEQLALIG